jgi:hypothetical protein
MLLNFEPETVVAKRLAEPLCAGPGFLVPALAKVKRHLP